MKPGSGVRAVVVLAVMGGMIAGATRAEAGDGTGKKRHPALGALLGTLAGLGAGTIIASHMRCWDNCDGPVAVFFGSAIAGGLLGYTAGGGFSGDDDRALNEGRNRVRQALAARGRADRPLPPAPPAPGIALALDHCFEPLVPGATSGT